MCECAFKIVRAVKKRNATACGLMLKCSFGFERGSFCLTETDTVSAAWLMSPVDLDLFINIGRRG